MATTKLSAKEKSFLAGCIKSMMLADGHIDNKELADLDKIIEELPFSDFDSSLEDFEKSVKDDETFWKLAEEITNETAQDIILSTLDELSLQDGFIDRNELELISQLEELWQ